MNTIDSHNPKGITRQLTIGIIFIIGLTTNSLISQDISTRGEIYDYDVYDIFHHEFVGGDGTNGERIITNIEIIDKYYSQNNDTVFYVRDVAKKTISSWNPVWIYSYYINTRYYTNLDSLINSGAIDTVYSNSNLYHGRFINEYEYDGYDTYYLTKYVVGCGNAEWYSYNTGGGESSDDLVYYKKGSEIWGQPLIVGVIDHESKDIELLIYPNPTSTTINVESDKPINGYVEIYSIKGAYIHKVEIQPDSKTLDISKLNPGTYIFKFYLEDSMVYKKIIKK